MAAAALYHHSLYFRKKFLLFSSSDIIITDNASYDKFSIIIGAASLKGQFPLKAIGYRDVDISSQYAMLKGAGIFLLATNDEMTKLFSCFFHCRRWIILAS